MASGCKTEMRPWLKPACCGFAGLDLQLKPAGLWSPLCAAVPGRKQERFYEQTASTPTGTWPGRLSVVHHRSLPHIAAPGAAWTGAAAGTHAPNAPTIGTVARPTRHAGLPGCRGFGDANRQEAADHLRPSPRHEAARHIGPRR